MDLIFTVTALVALIWFVWWSTRLENWNARAVCMFAALLLVAGSSAYLGSIFGRYFEANSFDSAQGPRAAFARVFSVLKEDLARGECQRASARMALLADGWTHVSLASRDVQGDRSYWALVQKIEAVKKEPNQSLEPTPTAGTSAAEQPLVPAAVVAHL